MIRSSRTVVALFATAALIVVAVGMFGAKRAPAPTRTGDSWPNDFTVEPGDRAVGFGQLVVRAGEDARLCTGLDIVHASMSAQYRCSRVSVVLLGIDLRAFSGVREIAGALYVDGVVVRGVWDGGRLTVDRIGGAWPAPASPPALRCDREVPGALPADPNNEAAYLAVQAEMDQHAHDYGGVWVDSSGGRTVLMVAATGDPLAAGTRLRSMFPYPLCVVRVERSSVELLATVAAATSSGEVVFASLLVESNAVLVRIPVLARSLVAGLEGAPGAILAPLLVKDSAEAFAT